jgi:hypothetical protein
MVKPLKEVMLSLWYVRYKEQVILQLCMVYPTMTTNNYVILFLFAFPVSKNCIFLIFEMNDGDLSHCLCKNPLPTVAGEDPGRSSSRREIFLVCRSNISIWAYPILGEADLFGELRQSGGELSIIYPSPFSNASGELRML